MNLKQNCTLQEFFTNKKVIVNDLDKLSLNDLFKISLNNQTFINELKNGSQKENRFLKNHIFLNTNAEKESFIFSHGIMFVNLTILVSAIFSVLNKKEEIHKEHHKIYENILKHETLYHLELRDDNNNFFKDFIINRIVPQKSFELSNFSKFLKFTFYHFEQEIQEMELQEINDLLFKITNYKLYIREVNLN